MKIRESGMPEQGIWESFFEPDEILTQLGLTPACRDVVEFGCGYGTFTLPAARRIRGLVHALDIDATSLAVAKEQAERSQQGNIKFALRDFIADGTGLPDASIDYVMIFNILHHEEPVRLLREAYRNLGAGGLAGVMHWKHNPDTPRGPPLRIRPRPEQCQKWAEDAGFDPGSAIIDLPPYHYGLILAR